MEILYIDVLAPILFSILVLVSVFLVSSKNGNKERVLKRLLLPLFLLLFSACANESPIQGAQPAINVPTSKGNIVANTAINTTAVELLDADEAFAFSVIAIDANTLMASWNIHPEYYLYHDKFFVDVKGAEFDTINFPKGKIKDDPLFGKVQIHKGRLEVKLPLKNIQTQNISFTSRYQGCWTGGICHPPLEKTTDIVLPIQGAQPTINVPTSKGNIVANTAINTTAVEPNETDQTAVLLFSILVLVSVFLVSSKNGNKERAELPSSSPLMKDGKIIQTKNEVIQLNEIATSLMLKKGEVAYFDIRSTLSETRAERRHQSVFAGKRNKNSTFFGGSTGRSKSHQVLTEIDSGSLILTNKRLAFDGKKTNRNIKLNKIMSIEIESNFFSSDQLEISIDGRQKSMYFSVSDTNKFKELITLAWQNY